MVGEIKDLTDQLSDFNSCVSELSDSDSASDDMKPEEETSRFLTMNQKRRQKRSKRKHSITPNKEDFLKKPNLGASAVL